MNVTLGNGLVVVAHFCTCQDFGLLVKKFREGALCMPLVPNSVEAEHSNYASDMRACFALSSIWT